MKKHIRHRLKTTLRRKEVTATTKTNTRVPLLSAFGLLALLTIGILMYRARDDGQTAANLPQNLRKADEQLVNQDYQEAEDILKGHVDKNATPAERYAAAYRLGVISVKNGQWQEAIKWFETAQATQEPGYENLYMDIAETAEKAGDRPKAIAAYQKVVEVLSRQSGPYAQSQVDAIQTKIRMLGG